MKLSETPITDNLEAAVELKYRLDMFLARARKKLGLPLPYDTQVTYIRVYFDEAKTKPYCMISINTGDIFRMNTLKAHMPGVRGNIYNEDFGVNCLAADGPAKFKEGIPAGTKLPYKPRPNRKKKEKPEFVHPTLIRVPELSQSVVTLTELLVLNEMFAGE